MKRVISCMLIGVCALVIACMAFLAPASVEASTLCITSGTINGDTLSPSDPTVTVEPGDSITGEISLTAVTTGGPGAVIALAGTPNWGDHDTSFWPIGSTWVTSNPPDTTYHVASVNLTAPGDRGTYYIFCALSGEFTHASTMSLTNWAYGDPVWYDSVGGVGVDVADWDDDQAQMAIDSCYTSTYYLFSSGYNIVSMAAAAIRVQVQELRIRSIRDIPNDQGRHVRVNWYRSPFDGAGADSLVVTEYSLWRRVDHDLGNPSLEEGNFTMETPPGDWDFIAAIPAVQDPTYNYVAPTLADSTINDGMYYSVFFVRAHTANPLVHWETEPDSGYSKDNLAPAVPEGLSADEGNQLVVLSWQSNSEPDLAYYAIYRSGFGPNTVFYTADTTYRDTTVQNCQDYYYKISAFDFSGNESDPSDSVMAHPVSVSHEGQVPELPQTFSLSQNHPNPFNPQTTIRYSLPEDTQVSLVVYNVVGQEIKTLVNERQKAGYYECVWNGTEVSSDIYFYRLQAGDFVETKRMVLLK